MVRVTMTDALVECIEFCKSHGVPGWPPSCIADEPELQAPALGKPITHQQVIALARCIQKWENSHKAESEECRQMHQSYSIENLLRNSSIYFPPPRPAHEPTTEYKILMARLREEEEAAAYRRMLSRTSHGREPANTRSIQLSSPASDCVDDADEMTFADINRQMTLIINVLLSIVACSVAIWIAAGHFSTAKRLGLSMSGSGIVGVAEIVVYAGYIRRVKEAKTREKKKSEVKEVIDSWVTHNDLLTAAPRKIEAVAEVTRRKMYSR